MCEHQRTLRVRFVTQSTANIINWGLNKLVEIVHIGEEEGWPKNRTLGYSLFDWNFFVCNFRGDRSVS